MAKLNNKYVWIRLQITFEYEDVLNPKYIPVQLAKENKSQSCEMKREEKGDEEALGIFERKILRCILGGIHVIGDYGEDLTLPPRTKIENSSPLSPKQKIYN
ncbi:hypothetical protein TNCV_5031031 [Trichonephila clavipes]|nr:hypothetical protein TNCV_5031031 [Trichonephila clavipes]